jgi:uncharacterized protein YkwD
MKSIFIALLISLPNFLQANPIAATPVSKFPAYLAPTQSYTTVSNAEEPVSKLIAEEPASKWTAAELERANTAKNAKYLSVEEKKIIFYMNLVRMDGKRFFDTYFQEYIDQHNIRMKQYSNYKDVRVSRNDAYYRGLEQDLRDIKDLGLLYPDETLSYVSRLHGKDMNKHNLAGHNSSDGRTMVDRIKKYYPNHGMAENLAFGFSSAIANVSLLLLDKGVPDLGHRKNILNKTLGINIVGVSIQPHPHFKYSATMDFVAIRNFKVPQ